MDIIGAPIPTSPRNEPSVDVSFPSTYSLIYFFFPVKLGHSLQSQWPIDHYPRPSTTMRMPLLLFSLSFLDANPDIDIIAYTELYLQS